MSKLYYYVRVGTHPKEDLERGYSYWIGGFGDESQAHDGLSGYCASDGIIWSLLHLHDYMGLLGGQHIPEDPAFLCLFSGYDEGRGPDGEDLFSPEELIYTEPRKELVAEKDAFEQVLYALSQRIEAEIIKHGKGRYPGPVDEELDDASVYAMFLEQAYRYAPNPSRQYRRNSAFRDEVRQALETLQPGTAVYTDVGYSVLERELGEPTRHSTREGAVYLAGWSVDTDRGELFWVAAVWGDPAVRTTGTLSRLGAASYPPGYASMVVLVEQPADRDLAFELAISAARQRLQEAIAGTGGWDATAGPTPDDLPFASRTVAEYVAARAGQGCEKVKVLEDHVVGAYWVQACEEITPAPTAEAAHRLADEKAASLRAAPPPFRPSSDRRVLSSLPRAQKRSDELQALVYSPKADQLFAAYGTSAVMVTQRLAARSGGFDSADGRGYFDEYMLGDCLRTHTPVGVLKESIGHGVALYAAMAVVAYQVFGVPCVASAPSGRGFGSRTPEGDLMWEKLAGKGGRPPLAFPSDVCQGCLTLALETLIGAGFVVWMSDPGEYEGLVAEAQSAFAQAFSGAKARTASATVAGILDDLYGADRERRHAQPNPRAPRRRELLAELYPGLTDL